MGDWADLMLDGVVCEACGVYLGDSVGYPRSCPSCESMPKTNGEGGEPSEPKSDRCDNSDDEDLPF